jgi:hypothetical protein
MTPGPITIPTPPEKVLRATRGVTSHRDFHIDPILLRYLRDIYLNGIIWIISFHYFIVIALVGGIWLLVMKPPQPHPEIILKLVGSFCFLIGSIVIPMIAPVILPQMEESDPGYQALPVEPLRLFNARFLTIMILSFATLLPMIPLFFLSAPALGRGQTYYDILPFLQALLTAGWVYTIMEMTGQSKDQSSRLARRLAVVIGFVFLHVALVGLLAQLSFATLQYMNPLKLVIDLNPFSQLFILMEGKIQNRLMLNTDMQHFIDYRLYLFILTGLVFMLVMAVYRSFLRSIRIEQ